MPPSRKTSASGFAAAAKVLFDSAQRVGAVQPLEQSTKQYAHQLKKIQSQSKKRGGSLGGVSYKVAEFLAAQRTPAPHPPPRANAALDRSIAKKVPLIDIPPISPVKSSVKHAAAASAARSQSAETGGTPLAVPSLSVVPRKPAEPAASASPRAPPPESAAPAEAVTRAAEAEAEAAKPSEEVLIMEDRPLFEVRQAAPVQPAAAAVLQPVVAAKPAESSAPLRRAKPVVSVPIAADVRPVDEPAPAAQSDVGEEVAPPSLSTSPQSFSVDAWEQQREKELERIQKKQDEEEQQRLAAARESAHRTLGKEWVERRSSPDLFEAEVTPGGKLLREVYYAPSPTAAIAGLQRMIDAGAKASSLLPAAISSVAHHICQVTVAEQTACKRAVLQIVDKAKLSDQLKRKAHLAFCGGSEFLAAYGALTPAEKQRLDPAVILKAARLLILNDQWEESLELAKNYRSNFRGDSDALDLTLLRVCRLLQEGPRKEVVAYATQSLTEQGRMGKTAKLLIAGSEAGLYRRTLLKQIAASADVDEAVYAELILRSAADQSEALLAEMRARGLNAEDPSVLAALAMKKLEDENPAAVFKEVERQTAKIGIRRIHILAATKAASLHPTEEVLRMATDLVMSIPAANRAVGLRKLLPLLYQHGFTKEIVDIVDKTNEAVPLADLVPKAVAFVNEALLKVGRPPLNEIRASDIGAAHLPDVTAAAPTSKAEARVVPTSVDLSGLTEKMLLYAKERQWAKAVETVTSLPPSIKADPSAVTLLYNCALSAAVEQPETVKRVYEMMKARDVNENATTVNTVLSSLSKSASWEEALPFFERTPLSKRDNNTYLVHFALLGKHGLWEEATAAYDEMRQSVPKPPAAMFSLVINTTSSHDWQTTLRVFQDMLKVHGAAVKDSVVSQVIRSLEQHNRSSEIAKLEKDLAKRKKKKK